MSDEHSTNCRCTNIGCQLVQILNNKQQLTQVLNKCQSLHDYSAKIKYATSLLKENNLTLDVPLRNSKSDSLSTEFRKIGNEHFAIKEFDSALKLYNQSICFAEQGSENLSIGYANRSAVYFEWQLYDRCFENIRLAREANYPVRLMHKLEKRAEECQNRKKTIYKKTSEPKVPILSYPANAQIPFMADCLELVQNEKFGRHIITNRDLKIGDVVIMEKPYETQLFKEYKYQRCTNCLTENDFSLIPCPDCTTTMFCSPQCLLVGNEKFHKYECPIADGLDCLRAGNLGIAGRVMFSIIHELDSIKELSTMMQDMNGSSSKYYNKAFHMLENNIENTTNLEIFHSALLVGTFFNLFMENTELKTVLDEDELRDIFLNLLFKYFYNCMTNAHALDVLERDSSKGNDTLKTVNYIFFFLSKN
jgi:SET and MYND domain-containing protein 4